MAKYNPDSWPAVWVLQLIANGNLHSFYTSREWKRLRREVLKHQRRRCWDCAHKAPAVNTRGVTVHHVKPLRERPDLALSEYDEAGNINLVCLCASCHWDRHHKQTAYDSVWGDCDSLYMLDMWQLRHFNLENSRILEGCTNYNLQYKVAAAETGVKRVLLTASQASGFVVGSTVSVGDKDSNSSADRYNTWMRDIADKVRVKSIETVTVGGTDYSAVNLDVADSFDVPETAYISSMPWHSGATEALPGHSDGAPGSLTNGKYPCRWAGVEMLNGAYVIGLDPLWNVATVDGGVTYTAMACRDSEKEASSVTANHVKVAEKTFASVNAWNYELSMQNDSTESLLPDKTGGGETVGMKSAFFVNGSAGVRCPWRCGLLGAAGFAGAACAYGDFSPAYSDWYGVPRLKGSGKKRGEWAGF